MKEKQTINFKHPKNSNKNFETVKIIDFSRIEKKWQDKWEKEKVFEVKENKNKKYYVLEQFAYPSGSGLHMGHAFIHTIGDIFARFKRMQGFNVLHPVGYDSLGLPAENAAIKAKTHPKTYTDNAIKYFSKQLKSLGFSYDWSRILWTHDPDYYKWDQWIFLKMFEKGLAFRKKASVNFCKKCNTVLANEQVHNGKCWRHEDTNVEIKHLEQWFLKITKYADELADFKNIEGWPDLIKKLQKNWIGKSHGTEILFEINNEKWPIFTTRPDTIYGVTFMVISAQHLRLMELVTQEQKKPVEKFLKKIKSVSEKELEDLDKQGFFTGSYAINPINKERVPVYVGNFVVADYGSGMVMAVPAHDQRDFEFAKKYKLPIKEVINRKETKVSLTSQPSLKMEKAFTNEGNLINSDKFNNLNNKKAITEITNYLETKKLGKKTINFKLRDWLISRQRYWGTPIPIIYCDKCGIVPVPEKDLPVKLPEKVKFGKGNPLETNKNFVNTKCPKCNGGAKRETDTMDTFANSSWYYLRYLDNKNHKEIFNKNKADYWCPIDMYIGGKEHACMHDIYIRFYTKFLRDLGLLKINEPAKKLFVQGMIHGKDGNKMSKSLGNTIDPIDLINKYSADALRLFLVSVASPDSDFNWSEKGVQGSSKFLKKILENFNEINIGKSSEKIESKINQTIKEISLDIEEFKYNLAVIKLRQLFDSLDSEKKVGKKDLEIFLKLLSPFCPHIAEELWEKLGNKNFISSSEWPKADEKKINKKFEQQDKAIEKLKQDVNNIKKIIQSKGEKKDKVYVYVLPNELSLYQDMGGINIFSVADKNKYDPTNKSKNTKPGKPAIYFE